MGNNNTHFLITNFRGFPKTGVLPVPSWSTGESAKECRVRRTTSHTLISSMEELRHPRMDMDIMTDTFIESETICGAHTRKY